MHTIDFCLDIGPWAFRRLEHHSVDALLALMDEYGIACAVAGPVPGITYRNCHAANEELSEILQAHPSARERLLQAAVLNPMYPGLEEDFRRCVEDMQCAALKLYPNYHGYQCWRSECVDLCKWAAERGIPVLVVVRVEDERFHHWKMLIPATPVGDVLKLVERVPEGTFVLVSGNSSETDAFLSATAGAANCLVETSYVKSPYNAIEALVNAQGSDRLLMGTHMPFVYPAPGIEKITRAKVAEEVKAQILGGNAQRVLGL